MATTVHKIQLEFAGNNNPLSIQLPIGAEMLTVAIQNNLTYLWYRCAPDDPLTERHIYCVGTGHLAPNKINGKYLSTILYLDGALVMHFFDDGRLI